MPKSQCGFQVRGFFICSKSTILELRMQTLTDTLSNVCYGTRKRLSPQAFLCIYAAFCKKFSVYFYKGWVKGRLVLCEYTKAGQNFTIHMIPGNIVFPPVKHYANKRKRRRINTLLIHKTIVNGWNKRHGSAVCISFIFLSVNCICP